MLMTGCIERKIMFVNFADLEKMTKNLFYFDSNLISFLDLYFAVDAVVTKFGFIIIILSTHFHKNHFSLSMFWTLLCYSISFFLLFLSFSSSFLIHFHLLQILHIQYNQIMQILIEMENMYSIIII